MFVEDSMTSVNFRVPSLIRHHGPSSMVNWSFCLLTDEYFRNLTGMKNLTLRTQREASSFAKKRGFRWPTVAAAKDGSMSTINLRGRRNWFAAVTMFVPGQLAILP